MRIFPPALTIGDEEGFTPERDIFGRAEIGQGLTNLVSSVADPLVIALDGQWGSGKTTFLKMWAGELRKAGFPVVYFDAFENDYAEDAFTTIAGEIIALADEHKKTGTAKAKTFLDKAVKAGGVLARSSLKLGAKAAAAAALGAIGPTDIEEFKEAVSDVPAEASSLIDQHVGELLTRSKQQKDTIRAFRDALAELPALLTKKLEDDKLEVDRPLVFIIDELDRCRPLFALEILERVKHFFSVPNVHFVLGVHLGQLRNSVAIAYGSGIDSHNYLQKFIHLNLSMTDNAHYRHERASAKFIEHLKQAMAFKAEDRADVEVATSLIALVAEHRGLSLRALERIMTTLALAMTFTNQRNLRIGAIVGGLCVLKATQPELYNKAREGRLSFDEVRDVLALNVTDNDENASEIDRFSKWWRYCTEDEFADEEQFGKSLWQYNIRSRKRVVPLIAQHVIDRLTPQR